MSKEVELHISIDKNGKIIATPKGTAGVECVDLMQFLNKINGVKNIEITLNEDVKKVNTVNENIDAKLN